MHCFHRNLSLQNLLIVLTLAVSYSAKMVQGQPALWQNSSGGFYETGSNWIPSSVPSPSSQLVFGLPGEYDISFLSDHTAGGLTVSNGANIAFTRGGVGSPSRRLTIAGDALIQSAQLVLEGDPAGGGFDLDISGDLSLVDNFVAGSAIEPLQIRDNTRVTSGVTLLDAERGAVSVSGERAGWEIDGNLSIGVSTDSDLKVFNGGSVTSSGDTVLGGSSAGTNGIGSLTVGIGLPGDLPTSFSTDRNTIIGNFGQGTLEVNAGGLVESGNRTQVAFGASSQGNVVVSGSDSAGNRATWNPGLLTLGLGGVANVEIEDGGLASSGNSIVGQDSSASVDVIGAEWNVDGTLRIGQNALGRLDLADGGRLTSGTTSLGGTSAANSLGQLFITGGLPTDPTTVWENTGDFYVGGAEDQALGEGNFVIAGDTAANISGTVKVWGDGRVNISLGAQFTADTIDHTHGGSFEFEGGTLHVNRFEGDLLNPNGTFDPGVADDTGLTTVFGDYTQQSAATLALDIGGTSAGATHDLVNITEVANLDGLLEVSVSDGFTPNPIDTFTVLSADSLFGVFDNANPGQRLDTIDGRGSFIVNYGIGSAFDESRIVLSDFLAAASIPGDFDLDGDVDGSDFLAWQRGNSPNPLSAGDLAIWRSARGNSSAAVAAISATTAVPEPATCGLAMLTVAIAACQRDTKRRQATNTV